MYSIHCGTRSFPIHLIVIYPPIPHDDVIKWKYFLRYWPFVWGIHRSPVNSPHKGQWRGALMFSLICAWINGWVNNRESADLRRHGAHYDVIVMCSVFFSEAVLGRMESTTNLASTSQETLKDDDRMEWVYKIELRMALFWEDVGKYIKRAILCLLFVGYWVYFGFAMRYSVEKNYDLIVYSVFLALVVLVIILRHFHTFHHISKTARRLKNKIGDRWIHVKRWESYTNLVITKHTPRRLSPASLWKITKNGL